MTTDLITLIHEWGAAQLKAWPIRALLLAERAMREGT